MNSAGAPHAQPAGPFGYSFFRNEQASSVPDAATTSTATAAAATSSSTARPTSGASLLNHQEEDYINTFFMAHAGQEMTNNTFDIAIQQAAEQFPDGNMTQFGWLMNEQPPNFITASATPKQTPVPAPYQHAAHHSSIDFGHHHQQHYLDGGDMLSSSNMHQSMLAHASMMQHGNMNHAHMQQQHHHHHHHHHQQTPSLVSAPSTEASDLMHTSDALQGLPVTSASLMGSVIPPTTILPHEIRDILGATPLSANALHNPLSGLAPLDTVHDIHYDGPHTAPARLDEATDARLFRFGSDSHFGLDGFKPSSNSERHDFIAQRLTEELHMLKPINRSNNPTRASSPSRHPRNHNHFAGAVHARKRSSAHFDGPGAVKTEDDGTGYLNRPKKRRKDSADEDEPGSAGLPPSKREFSMPTNPRLRRVSSSVAIADHDPTSAHSQSPTSASRRRSSMNAGPGAASGKPARENLSEEQKRNNHIHSEQKRRNLIKQGFDELRVLVPELRAGGLSKSMELMEVSNFLEQVINANKELRSRLGIVKPA